MSYPERGAEGLLTWLPTELLEHIFSEFSLNHCDLFHISLTNSRLRDIIQPILYGHVILTSDQAAAIETFSELVCKNPALPPLLRHLEFKNRKGHEWIAFPENVAQALQNVLTLRLPKLRSLRIELAKVSLDIYQINSTLPVRAVYVEQATLGQAISLLLLPRIEELEIGAIVGIPEFFTNEDIEPPSIVSSNHTKSSSLRKLRIGRRIGPHNVFLPLVTWPKDLHELDITISFGANDMFPYDQSGRLFQSLSESLRTLRVRLSAGPTIDDQPRYDQFNCFKCLTRLEGSSSLLFGFEWDQSDVQSADFYKRLPQTLESLSIWFSVHDMAFRSGRVDPYIGDDLPEDYRWITGLVNLPKLKSVQLAESPLTGDGDRKFEVLNWNPHPFILECYARRGIDFTASLRNYPKYLLDGERRRAMIEARRLARRRQ